MDSGKSPRQRAEDLQANDTAGELDWLRNWVEAAKTAAASPYPDTYDFISSGIDPKTFAAMTELQRCLLIGVVGLFGSGLRAAITRCC